jgi:hypothetical protein
VASSQARPGQAVTREAILRVLASACIAGGLGLIFWLVFYIGSRSRFTAGNCGGGPWGCLGEAIVGGLLGILAIVLVAWPLLHAVGVRPAWPVALVGPGVALSGFREFVTLTNSSVVSGLWILLAVSYAAAAMITAPRLYRYWSAAVAMAVVALDLVTRFIGGRW